MYDSGFGFKRAPFSAVADWRLCTAVPTFRAAYREISNCLVGDRGIAVLTAPAGTGKSLLCQLLAEELSQEFRVVLLANGGYATRSELLQAILFELGLPFQGLNEQELRLQLTAAVRKIGGKQTALVLLADEAHSNDESVLDELRAMTNLVLDGQPLVRILLSGQFELEEVLASPRLDALNQRVGCHATLEPLSRAESANYIEQRLRQIGANLADVFTPEAVRTIAFAADGNPRCLNQLCDRSLSLASQYGIRPVPDDIVRRALADLKQLPLHWNEPPAIPNDKSSHERVDMVSPERALDEELPVIPEQPASGEAAAVVEFGADDETVVVENAMASQPEATQSPGVWEVGADRPIDAEKPAPAPASIEFGAGAEESRSQPPAATTHLEICREQTDSDWQSVEQRTTTVPPASASNTTPAVSFGKTMAAGKLRSLSKHNPTAAAPILSAPTASQEIPVADHYAELLDEQRRPRAVQPEPQPAAQPDQNSDDDCPSRLLMDDECHPGPEIIIDSVMAAVQHVVMDGVRSTPPPLTISPARTGSREIDEQQFGLRNAAGQNRPMSSPDPALSSRDRREASLPSLQDLLNEIEFDIVRPLEDDSPPLQVSSSSDVRNDAPSPAAAPRPYIDLFTRLRRLQSAE